MKKEFIVERQGKSFVLYAGLLDVAHAKGLRRITTELVQIPDDTNGQNAIVHATVEIEDKVFSGLGDAAPHNVAPPMRTCLIRMAETRAKARALRDAINVSAVAFEELAPDEEDLSAFDSRDEKRPRPLHAVRTEDGTKTAATAAQVKAIYGIARHERQLSETDVDSRCVKTFGRPTGELTRRQASEVIDRLKAGNW